MKERGDSTYQEKREPGTLEIVAMLAAAKVLEKIHKRKVSRMKRSK